MSNPVAFTAHVISRHGKDILARDRARAQKYIQGVNPHGPVADGKGLNMLESSRGASGTTGIDVTDAGVTYTMSVGVGKPATDYTLLIDTGSSNTWVGADKKYKPTTSSKSTEQRVNVSYGSGTFSGIEYTDTITLSPELVIKGQSIGVASTAKGFNGVDGILGIGPTGLTQGTVSSNKLVPTVTDNLFSQGTIATECIGICYAPTGANGEINGELTFGGVDDSKTAGDIKYVPITSTSPADGYWGIDQTITYGDGQTLLDSTAGIVDTGTTLIMIASDAFEAYQKATGAQMDENTGLLTVSEDQYKKMQNMVFNIGGVKYELTPNAQIWPRCMYKILGGEEGKIYLVIADMGSPSGQGLDFINGFCFLQRFYSVYDTSNKQVGFAPTSHTDADVN